MRRYSLLILLLWYPFFAAADGGAASDGATQDRVAMGSAGKQRVVPAQTYDFVAFLPDPTGDADYLEMVDSLEAYADYLRATGIGEFHVHFFTHLKAMERFLAERNAAGQPPALGVVHNLLVVANGKKWNFTPIACPIYKGSIMTRQLVVAPRSSSYRSVKDLRGKRIAVVKMWAETPRLLGVELLDGPEPVSAFFSSILGTDSLTDCLRAVIGRQVDAAMVNEAFFDVARKRNRMVWKELKVVAKLPVGHISPVVAFAGASPELREKVKAVIFNAQESDAGRHLLEVFNLDGFDTCSIDDFRRTEGVLLAKLPSVAETAPPKSEPAAAAQPDRPPILDIPVSSIQVERDADSGEVDIVVRFGKSAPSGLKASLSPDGGAGFTLDSQCAADICLITVPGPRIKGSKGVTLRLLVDQNGKTSQIGKSHHYPLAP